MKWIFLISIITAVVPFAMWLRRNPGSAPLVWTAFGFLAVQHGPLHLYVAPVSWALWPGFVKGLEVSILDAFALSLLLSQPPAKEPWALRYAFVFYMLAVLLAVTQAEFMTPALFYPWQTARIFFVAFVVSRAVANDTRMVAPLVQGLGYGLLLALAHSVAERFAGGALQAAGGFQHQNQLGMITNLIALVYFSLLLAGGVGWMIMAIPVAGAIIAILTVSRGTIAVLFAGYAALFMLSGLRCWTSRKTRVAVASALAAAVVLPMAISTLDKRMGDRSIFETDQERTAFERAAGLMLNDHPFGVGPNHYVVATNTQGYSDRAGVLPRAESRAAHVHNLYWLSVVETGYIGILSYALLLMQPLVMAFTTGWRHRHDWRGELLLGLGVGLVAIYSQSTLEWIFVSFQVQYIFGLVVGLVAGLCRSVKRPQTK